MFLRLFPPTGRHFWTHVASWHCRVQARGPFLNDRSIELYWSSICKCHLERFINADSSCTVELRFDVDVDMLLQQGACSSEAESSFMPTLLLQRHWKCLFRELVGGAVQAYAAHGRSCMSEKDPDQNLGTEAVAEQSEPEEEEEDLYPLYPADRLRPGSLRTTAGNELRCTLEEFRFLCSQMRRRHLQFTVPTSCEKSFFRRMYSPDVLFVTLQAPSVVIAVSWRNIHCLGRERSQPFLKSLDHSYHRY